MRCVYVKNGGSVYLHFFVESSRSMIFFFSHIYEHPQRYVYGDRMF